MLALLLNSLKLRSEVLEGRKLLSELSVKFFGARLNEEIVTYTFSSSPKKVLSFS